MDVRTLIFLIKDNLLLENLSLPDSLILLGMMVSLSQLPSPSSFAFNHRACGQQCTFETL